MASNIFVGETGHVISLTIGFTILLMMLAMAVRLYLSRKRHTYFSLTASVLLLVLVSIASIYGRLRPEDYSSSFKYILAALSIIGVQQLLLCFYQLYNASLKNEIRLFYGLVSISVLLAGIHLFVFKSVHIEDKFLQYYYLATLVFLFVWMPTQVGQAYKYRLALFSFAAAQIASLFHKQKPIWEILSSYLPIVAEFTLFLILFERVVELLQNISKSSITDPLTGLYNRRYFDNKVTQFLKSNKRVSVMFSDIDNFKRLNDTQGHDMGDKILKQVANILQEESERIGIAGRYGGEEMVVLITDPQTRMRKFAETIRERVQNETIVTVSIGYSESVPGISADQIIKQADEGMYIAKKSGKNKVIQYTA